MLPLNPLQIGFHGYDLGHFGLNLTLTQLLPLSLQAIFQVVESGTICEVLLVTQVRNLPFYQAHLGSQTVNLIVVI